MAYKKQELSLFLLNKDPPLWLLLAAYTLDSAFAILCCLLPVSSPGILLQPFQHFHRRLNLTSGFAESLSQKQQISVQLSLFVSLL